MTTSVILLIIASTATNGFWLIHLASGQPIIANKPPLPVILIHGYFEDKSVWSEWQKLLQNKGIRSFPITFRGPDRYDECGSANQHALELAEIIKEVKMKTGQDKVNIVAHSKGGLDARVYLADNITRNDVANLIMIGTPNAGSPLADLVVRSSLSFYAAFGNAFANYWLCKPAIYDLQTNAIDTHAAQNPNTNYYTIAGDWNPLSLPLCSAWAVDTPGFNYLRFYLPTGLHNDGVVPVDSVGSQSYFHDLTRSHPTSHCNQDLLGYEEYKLAEPILLGKQ
jgi:triacylglycerol esterase/lipase EstA (alpha/beta hydrolase family)